MLFIEKKENQLQNKGSRSINLLTPKAKIIDIGAENIIFKFIQKNPLSTIMCHEIRFSKNMHCKLRWEGIKNISIIVYNTLYGTIRRG